MPHTQYIKWPYSSGEKCRANQPLKKPDTKNFGRVRGQNHPVQLGAVQMRQFRQCLQLRHTAARPNTALKPRRGCNVFDFALDRGWQTSQLKRLYSARYTG